MLLLLWLILTVVRWASSSDATVSDIVQEKVINDVLLADQPSKKFVKPEEIGALVRHLCSDDAQSFQGACISIDGGWTAR